MASGQNAVLHQLERLFTPGTVAGLSEWQLLSRYVSRRDEAAFEALVARHGPMVLGVCRRMLADPNDVDDAFQTTFLVLVKKATSLGEHDAIGHWLYGVAHRVALRARAEALDRRRREGQKAASVSGETAEHDPLRGDLACTLDQELLQLPAKYRAPIVLCYIEGLTHEEASRALGWPLGTVKGRLARARDVLKSRLTRRGLALTPTALGAWLASDARAALPESLLKSTVASSFRVAEGPLAAGVVSASITRLLEGVLTTMYWTKLKIAAMTAMLILGVLAVGAGVVAQQGAETGPRTSLLPAAIAAPSLELKAETVAPPVSPPGDLAAALPGNEPARPSTTADPAQRDLASQIFTTEFRAFSERGAGDVPRLAQWSLKVVDASGGAPAERRDALEKHLTRMTALEEQAQRRRTSGQGAESDALIARYYRQEARRLISQAETGPGSAVPARARIDHAADNDPRTLSILQKLEAPISMSFANETPLEDILKYILSATTGEKERGIPIYVDPLGLQAAEKTMTSPVTLDLEGVPLRITLKLMLQQLGLIYVVEDGLLTITFQDRGETPLETLENRARRGDLDENQLKQLTATLKAINEIERLKLENRKMRRDGDPNPQ